MCDTVWGFLRFKVIEKKRSSQSAFLQESFIPNLLNDNRLYSLFQLIEDMIDQDQPGVKYMQPYILDFRMITQIAFSKLNLLHLLHSISQSCENVLLFYIFEVDSTSLFHMY